jgi:hypothetical protein
VSGRTATPFAAFASLLVAVLLMSGYAGSVKQDQNYYNVASALRARHIAEIDRLKPAVPPDGVVLLADFSSQIGPPGAHWFPTIEDQWDASEIIQMTYDQPNLAADPLFARTQCLASTMSIGAPTGPETVPYAKVVVIDLGRKRVEHFENQAQCQAKLPSLVATA